MCVIIDDAACDDEVVVEDFNLLTAAEASPMGHIESHCGGRPSMVSSLLLHRLWRAGPAILGMGGNPAAEISFLTWLDQHLSGACQYFPSMRRGYRQASPRLKAHEVSTGLLPDCELRKVGEGQVQ